MDLSGHKKGEVRKYHSLLKSVNGDKAAAKAMFEIWMNARPKKASDLPDPIADQILEVMTKHLPATIKLGNLGYALKRAKGKNQSGFVVFKLTKEDIE